LGESSLEVVVTRFAGIVALGVAASVAACAPAYANGGDFFEELQSTWLGANAEQGVPFFGFAKDRQGKSIQGVSVSATTPSGSTFVVQTDNKGRYRFGGFSKSVDAKRVEITCSKPGFKLFARDKRVLRASVPVPIETNCVLVPDAGARPAA
jgi:hypothetical protein